jgi:excisionase family DNA binding protein
MPKPIRRPHPRHRDDAHRGTTAASDNPMLYTPTEAAQRLQVRESWLRKQAAARQVPCTFLGKHLRFSTADLATIIAAAARAPVGRKPRRRPAPGIRGDDLPAPPQRSVHAHRDDHQPDGSSPWPG